MEKEAEKEVEKEMKMKKETILVMNLLISVIGIIRGTTMGMTMKIKTLGKEEKKMKMKKTMMVLVNQETLMHRMTRGAHLLMKSSTIFWMTNLALTRKMHQKRRMRMRRTLTSV